jgi:hypothetical protein
MSVYRRLLHCSSGLRPFHGSLKEREHKKFLVYSVYAWGSPFVMLLVCMVMDLVPGLPGEYIKPDFGVRKCWFSSKYTCTVSRMSSSGT